MAGSKDETKTGWGTILVPLFVIVLIAFAIIALLMPDATSNFFSGVNDFIDNLFTSDTYMALKLISGIITVVFTAISFWLFLRLREMEREHEAHVYHHDTHEPGREAAHHAIEGELREGGMFTSHTKTAPPPQTLFVDDRIVRDKIKDEKPGLSQWQSVLKHVHSTSESDWKLSIIEADTILDILAYNAGFSGATLGERLKNADRGLFKTLDFAREAHGVRNRIAHSETPFHLTEREAKRVIKLYEAVFQEFNYI